MLKNKEWTEGGWKTATPNLQPASRKKWPCIYRTGSSSGWKLLLPGCFPGPILVSLQLQKFPTKPWNFLPRHQSPSNLYLKSLESRIRTHNLWKNRPEVFPPATDRLLYELVRASKNGFLFTLVQLRRRWVRGTRFSGRTGCGSTDWGCPVTRGPAGAAARSKTTSAVWAGWRIRAERVCWTLRWVQRCLRKKQPTKLAYSCYMLLH